VVRTISPRFESGEKFYLDPGLKLNKLAAAGMPAKRLSTILNQHAGHSFSDLVKYVSKSTGTDYTPFFDQYLRHPAIPVLELAFETSNGKSYVSYRWVTAVSNFNMPVRCMLRNGEWVLLHPATEWQKQEYFMASSGHINLDTNQFYIEVRVRE